MCADIFLSQQSELYENICNYRLCLDEQFHSIRHTNKFSRTTLTNVILIPLGIFLVSVCVHLISFQKINVEKYTCTCMAYLIMFSISKPVKFYSIPDSTAGCHSDKNVSELSSCKAICSPYHLMLYYDVSTA
jgi:hypothetical protein